MLINKSYKFRLYPTKEQIPTLKQHAGNSRFTWNKLLEYANAIKHNTKKYPNWCDLAKQVIELKKNNEFLGLSYSQPLQVNAQRLNVTFQKALKPEVVAKRNKKIAIAKSEPNEEIRNKKLVRALNFGFPKFKAKAQSKDSIFYPQHFVVKKSRILFPKLGWINYVKHRDIEGKPKFLTITQDGDQWYVSITTELEVKENAKPELSNANIVGIDVGLTTFATMSDGTTIENPRILKKYMKKLRKESRKLSRQKMEETNKKSFSGKTIKESSQNRNKQIIKLQRIHRKIRNIRKDFLHNFTHNIITKYDGVILEDLDIQELLKKNGKAMNRSISDVSWFEFGRMMEYKSAWASKHFMKVDQYFPSTQKCSRCGSISHMSLKNRVYKCSNCKLEMGRDPNASLNLRNEGIRLLKDEQNTKNTKSTVATTGIEVCGPDVISTGLKQKKRRFRQSATVVA